MQKDFHYYCVAVLAKAAGFGSNDALTIAYASQYVDDATEGSRMLVKIGSKEIPFDPTRTAYDLGKLKQGLATLEWTAQKRIYLPFHFLPAEPFDHTRPDRFSYVTKPDSTFADMVLKRAAAEPNPLRRLCALGIALHTYADTWAHEGFSGRYESAENNVEAIEVYNRANGQWEHLVAKNLIYDIMPEIGHAEAGHFPDLTYQRWRCRLGKPGEIHERDNLDRFMEAVRALYQRLREIAGAQPAFDPVPGPDLEALIRPLLADESHPTLWQRLMSRVSRKFIETKVNDRCTAWKAKFDGWFEDAPPGISYDYSKETWREQALPGDVDWDPWPESRWRDEPARTIATNFWELPWVHFHRAALAQRHFVLEQLP